MKDRQRGIFAATGTFRSILRKISFPRVIYQNIVCRRSCAVERPFPDSPEYLIDLVTLRVLLKSMLELKWLHFFLSLCRVFWPLLSVEARCISRYSARAYCMYCLIQDFVVLEELNWIIERISMGLKRKPPQGNVRNVVSMGGNLCSAITNKEGETVQAESFQERNLALLFQRDKSVINYQSQPETFVFTDRNGKSRKY